MVEHLGSGPDRIVSIYGKESFKISQNFMKNVFYKKSSDMDVSLSEGVKNLYELIKNNPNNRSTYFAKELDTSVKNTERWIKQPRDKDKIVFQRSPKNGGYVSK